MSRWDADNPTHSGLCRQSFYHGRVGTAQCFDNRGASVNNGLRPDGIAATLSAHETPQPGHTEAEAHRGDEGARPPSSPRPAGGETGGPRGLEPTRYGDWERNGRCIDF